MYTPAFYPIHPRIHQVPARRLGVMSDRKVLAALESYPRPVTLRQPRWIRYADIAGALGTLAIGFKIGTGTVACPPVGLLLALVGGLVLGLAIRDLRKPCSLTLYVNSFRLREGEERVTVPWSYVQHFREVGDETFAVGFDLVTPDGATSDSLRLPEAFGLKGPDLLALLTQWHAKSLGMRHPRSHSRGSMD